MSEYVYFLRNPKTGLTKIGRSIQPHTRKINLESKHKTKLEIIAVAKTSNGETLEAEIHKRYDANRVAGEWFDLKSPLQEARDSLAGKLLDWSEAVRVEKTDERIEGTLGKIGIAAKKQLIDLNLTQGQLAEKVGVSRQTVNYLLAGKGDVISRVSIEILEHLGLELVVRAKE